MSSPQYALKAFYAALGTNDKDALKRLAPDLPPHIWPPERLQELEQEARNSRSTKWERREPDHAIATVTMQDWMFYRFHLRHKAGRWEVDDITFPVE